MGNLAKEHFPIPWRKLNTCGCVFSSGSSREKKKASGNINNYLRLAFTDPWHRLSTHSITSLLLCAPIHQSSLIIFCITPQGLNTS